MVKNIAILAVPAVFLSVDIIPEATPLSSEGTEFIIEAVLGVLNIPLPIPIKNSAKANSMKLKLIGRTANNMKDIVTIIIPPVDIQRGP